MSLRLDHLKVKHTRIKKGWTQQQLADICQVSIRTIQRAERDGNASIETVSALSSVLEIARDDLWQTAATDNNGFWQARTIIIAIVLAFSFGLSLGIAAAWWISTTL